MTNINIVIEIVLTIIVLMMGVFTLICCLKYAKAKVAKDEDSAMLFKR